MARHRPAHAEISEPVARWRYQVRVRGVMQVLRVTELFQSDTVPDIRLGSRMRLVREKSEQRVEHELGVGKRPRQLNQGRAKLLPVFTFSFKMPDGDKEETLKDSRRSHKKRTRLHGSMKQEVPREPLQRNGSPVRRCAPCSAINPKRKRIYKTQQPQNN